MATQDATLAGLAERINQLLDKSDNLEITANKRRWEAGIELIKAKALVRHGEWQTWCKTNITRSLRDIQKVMHMAGSDDPMAEHEAEIVSKREARSAAKVTAKAAPRAHLDEVEMQSEGAPPQDEPDEPSITRLVPKDETVGQILSLIGRLSSLSDLTRVRDHVDARIKGIRNVA